MSVSPALRYLRDYVAIPSVNPMRRTDLDPEIVGERRYAEHLRRQFEGLRLDVELVGPPDRPSVIAVAEAAGARETLVVASHLDTVPVDGMEIEPFDPRLDAGRLYGRGSCDTKAGMAGAVAALERVLADGGLARNVVLVGEADEELGSRGIRDVLSALRREPDWLVATEPTSLRVVTRHKGVVHTRISAAGRACHASEPAGGSNAIVALARAALALDQLGRRVSERRDERLGAATLSIGVIGGGSAPNIVPDQAWLLIDHRLLPGEDEHSVRGEVLEALAAAGLQDLSVDWCRLEKPPLHTPDEHPGARAVAAAVRAAGGTVELAGAAFGTDAGVAAAAGIPGVVFGPGGIAQAHTAREFVEADQVERAQAVFKALFRGAE